MQRFADILKTWPFRLIVRPTFACKSLKSVKYSSFSCQFDTFNVSCRSFINLSDVYSNHSAELLKKDY